MAAGSFGECFDNSGRSTIARATASINAANARNRAIYQSSVESVSRRAADACAVRRRRIATTTPAPSSTSANGVNQSNQDLLYVLIGALSQLSVE